MTIAILVAVVAVALDLATTLVAVRRFGPGVEANPVWRRLMRRSVEAFVAAFLAAWATLGVVAGTLGGEAGLYAMAAASFGVAGLPNCWQLVRRQGQRPRHGTGSPEARR